MKVMCLLGLTALLIVPSRAGNGDANLDGRVDLADAATALRFAAGLSQPSFGQRVAADVPKWGTSDGLGPIDGVVNVADAVQIARIAGGLDPALPEHALPTIITLSSPGDIVQNVALDAGYQVSGHARENFGDPLHGRIVFYRWVVAAWGDVPSVAYSADVNTGGTYSAVLPPGPYVPVLVAESTTTTPLGGVTRVGIPDTLLNGNDQPLYTAAADTNTRDFSALPTTVLPTTAYISAQGAPGTSYTSREMHLTQSTDNGTEIYGAHRTVAPDSGSWLVQSAAYAVRLVGDLTLSDGSTEPWTTFVDQYTVPNTYALNMTIGPFVEVTGIVTPPPGFTAKSVELREMDTFPPNPVLQPNPRKILTSVPIQPDGTYRIAGTRDTFAVVFTATSPDFTAQYTIQYRFGTDPATLNMTMPDTLPARTVSGQVVGPNGRAVGNAAVNIGYEPYGNHNYAYSTSTVTDVDGHYSAKIPNGSFPLKVSF